MTQSQLVVALYSRYEIMHQVWMSLAGCYGPGALMFFPEDYAEATSLYDIQWRYWRTSDVLAYLTRKLGDEAAPVQSELEECTAASLVKFVAVITTRESTPGGQQIQVHFVPRVLLN